jgi:RimJ/RimL family protein N-acetyltransferase
MQGYAPNRAMVILKDENRIIGDVRFEPIGRGPQVTYEIGYAIAPTYRRKGYASEAMRQIISWLDEDVCADEIVAGCNMENGASVRTLIKLGFLLDGSSPNRHAFWWIWEGWDRLR